MLPKEPPQLTAADAKPIAKRLHPVHPVVERAVGNERQRTRDGAGGAAPAGELGGALGPAAEARPEAGVLRGGGRRKEAAVLEPGGSCRADRAAVDPGREHADEEPAIESLVTRLEGAIAAAGIAQVHAPTIAHPARGRSRFSDLTTGG